MALVTAPATPSSSAHDGAALRDPGIDLVRALCVVGVVLLHAIMVGVTIEGGAPVFENASVGTWWIVPVSWLLQVMPLFFVIAGFSGLLSYRRHRVRGGSDTAFVAARVHRLLRPALYAVGIVGTALTVLALCGIPAEFVATAGFRYGQPLWFLAVFLGCQALLPALARMHESAPLLSIGALSTFALTVDILRALTGNDGLGFLNLAFVWIALQQLGFFLADGTIDALTRRTRGVLGLSATAALFLACAFGIFSPDLIANINPPTTALLLVGLAHTSVLSLYRSRVTRFSRRPLVARITAFITPRTMTIYLWHMPVLLTMAGLTAAFALHSGLSLPALSSVDWWMQRPLWLATTLALTALAALPLARWESGVPAPSTSGAAVTGAVLLGAGGTLGLLLLGTSPLTAAFAVSLYALALRLAARRSPVRPEGYARPRALSASPTSSA